MPAPNIQDYELDDDEDEAPITSIAGEPDGKTRSRPDWFRNQTTAQNVTPDVDNDVFDSVVDATSPVGTIADDAGVEADLFGVDLTDPSAVRPLSKVANDELGDKPAYGDPYQDTTRDSDNDGIADYQDYNEGAPGGEGGGSGGSGDPLTDYFDYLEKSGAKKQAYIDDFYGQAMPEFRDAAAEADANDDGLAQQMFQEYAKNYGPLESSEYVGDADSEAANAAADQRAIDAQYDALNKFKRLSDPEVTAKERFLMETARRAEERDRKAAMDAALRDMEARGVRSGGAEIAALLGAQQTTSENRMLQDLGTQAGAVDRSMLALQNYGDLSGDIRDSSFDEAHKRGTAADVMSRFNKQQRQDYNIWRDERASIERDKGWGRTLDFQEKGRDTVDRKYGRDKDIYNVGRDELEFRTGANEDDEDDMLEYYKLKQGAKSEEAARKALEDDDKWEVGPFKLPKVEI